MAGFIKIYRSCRNNVLWKDKPFSRWQAFEDLLLSAAYEPHDTIIKGQIVHLERGQLIRGIHNLSADWGWSVKKTNSFMKLLENQKMAISKGTPQGTLITIENYSIYQDEGLPKGTPKGTAKGTHRVQQRVEEEEREEGEERKEDKYSELNPLLVVALKDFIEHRKKIKKAMTGHAIDLLLKKTNELSNGNIDLSVKLLNEATMNGWLTVYPLKNTQPQTNKGIMGVDAWEKAAKKKENENGNK